MQKPTEQQLSAFLKYVDTRTSFASDKEVTIKQVVNAYLNGEPHVFIAIPQEPEVAITTDNILYKLLLRFYEELSKPEIEFEMCKPVYDKYITELRALF